MGASQFACFVPMKPWERRLDDLAYALQNCAKTYFDPNLFRRNVNHFLQTARTVTFLVQKAKATVTVYDSVYPSFVERWREDPVMSWAKDSRNTVEKQGDLELNSTLRARLIFGYLEEFDLEIEVGREELLGAHVAALEKLVKERFSEELWTNAAVRIERAWMTEKLPERELLSALMYTFAQLHTLCVQLARAEGRILPDAIPDPSMIHINADEIERFEYVRVRDGQIRKSNHEVISRPDNLEMPDWLAGVAPKLKLAKEQTHDFHTAVHFHTLMAESTFKNFGNHLPMVFLYDPDWQAAGGATTPMLEDQVDKYIFWRALGDQIRIQGAHAFAIVIEAWIRDIKHSKGRPMSELPIIGEQLHLTVCSRDGEFQETIWDITRDGDDKPMLSTPQIKTDDIDAKFVYIPAMRGLGLEPRCVELARGSLLQY